MRKHIFQILLFTCGFAISLPAQDYHKIVFADSLANENEITASINLINEVLDANPRNFLKSQAYFQLSELYLKLYDFEKASDFNQKSKEIRDLLRYEYIADNIMQSGAIALLENNSKAALDYFLIAREFPHSSIQFSGLLDGNIAVAYEQMEKYDLALDNYKNALDILIWTLGENHPEVSKAHFTLANFYERIGDPENAVIQYNQTILIELKNNWNSEVPNPLLATAYNAVGRIGFKENSSVEEAFFNFRGATLASTGINSLMAITKMNIAQIYLFQKELEKAATEIDQAIDLLHKEIGKAAEKLVPLFLNKDLYINALTVKNKIILATEKKNINTETLLKVYGNCLLAIQVFEHKIPRAQKEKYIPLIPDNFNNIYEQAMYYGLKLFDLTKDEKYRLEAFRFAEKGKWLTLKNDRKPFLEIFKKDWKEDLQKAAKDIQYRIAFFETSYAKKYFGETYDSELKRLDQDYQSLLFEIEKSSPRYFAVEFPEHQFTFSELQNKLQEDETLLSYYLGEKFYYIFAIQKSEIQIYSNLQNALFSDTKNITKDSAIINAGFDFLKTVKNDEEHFDNEHFVATNFTLYRRLIEPLAPSLRKTKKLIIVPHGNLCLVNFETIIQSKPRRKIKFHKLDYLLRDYEISYELSLDQLLNKTKTSLAIPKAISAWAPMFNPEDSLMYPDFESVLNSDAASLDSIGFRSFLKGKSSFKFMPQSGNEVKAVLANFEDQGLKKMSYVGKAASETAFKKSVASTNHIHISAPALINQHNPGFSGIALAPSIEDNGMLYLEELLSMDFKNTQLIFLSKSESNGMGKNRNQYQNILRQAFTLSGADYVIQHQGMKSPDADAELIENFYKKVLDGATYSEALRYAKIKMFKRTKTAHPDFWSGYKLTGS